MHNRNLWYIRHKAVRVLTNRSTGRFVLHLALLPLVREPGDQATTEGTFKPPVQKMCPIPSAYRIMHITESNFW